MTCMGSDMVVIYDEIGYDIIDQIKAPDQTLEVKEPISSILMELIPMRISIV